MYDIVMSSIAVVYAAVDTAMAAAAIAHCRPGLVYMASHYCALCLMTPSCDTSLVGRPISNSLSDVSAKALLQAADKYNLSATMLTLNSS